MTFSQVRVWQNLVASPKSRNKTYMGMFEQRFLTAQCKHPGPLADPGDPRRSERRRYLPAACDGNLLVENRLLVGLQWETISIFHSQAWEPIGLSLVQV